MKNELQTTHSDKLLNSIYKNVQMGLSAIHNIITIITDEELRKCLLKQKNIYEDVSRTCEGYGKKFDIQLTDVNILLKATSYVSIKTKASINKNAHHHADMLIQGTTMGVTDLIKDTSIFSMAHSQIIALANKMKDSEEAFIESLKVFLTQ